MSFYAQKGQNVKCSSKCKRHCRSVILPAFQKLISLCSKRQPHFYVSHLFSCLLWNSEFFYESAGCPLPTRSDSFWYKVIYTEQFCSFLFCKNAPNKGSSAPLKSHLLQLKSPLLQLSLLCMLLIKSPLLQLKSPLLHLKSPLLQLKSALLQLKSPLLQLKSPFLQ